MKERGRGGGERESETEGAAGGEREVKERGRGGGERESEREGAGRGRERK